MNCIQNWQIMLPGFSKDQNIHTICFTKVYTCVHHKQYAVLYIIYACFSNFYYFHLFPIYLAIVPDKMSAVSWINFTWTKVANVDTHFNCLNDGILCIKNIYNFCETHSRGAAFRKNHILLDSHLSVKFVFWKNRKGAPQILNHIWSA